MSTFNGDTLIITNGDSAVNIMQEAGLHADYIPWRDVLHDGPVPSDLALDELSAVRAEFIISQGWGNPDDIRRSFKDRDQMLASYQQYKKVLLWFEHDLYDQLQVLQILDWFSGQNLSDIELSMICTEQYLGLCSVDELKSLLPFEVSVTQQQLTLAKHAWAAFRAPGPEPWRELLDRDTSALPFLQDAVLRQLQEYPSSTDGLGLTARRALQIIADGETNLWRVFERYQESEERRFMGDYSFWAILNQMLTSTPACLVLSDGESLNPPVDRDSLVNISQAGLDLLDGKLNWLELHQIDQWIGGVHIREDNLWRWDNTLLHVLG